MPMVRVVDIPMERVGPIFYNLILWQSYVIDGHIKNFIFRKDWRGFEDWAKSINKMRYLISAHKKGITTYTDEEYTEANWWYVNYLEFMKGLNEKQKEYIRAKEKGHIPEYSSYTGEDISIIYTRWLEVVADFKLNRLESITNEEVGEAIKRARLFKCMNRAQVSEVTGIKTDTLRFYEDGKRTVPFDIFYKLSQIFNLDISK